MRIKSKLFSLFTIFIFLVSDGLADELGSHKPLMLKSKNYTEYWEQFFYLSDGSLITSQFLVANFPWPVGNEHGVMLGTLVTPEGKLYVIKNGRNRENWGYNEKELDFFIHTHRLKTIDNGYSIHLENSMASIDLQLKSNQLPLSHKKFSSSNGFMETSFYAPSLIGNGKWQLGPEAGFESMGPVQTIDQASGFGVHVIMTDTADQLIKHWVRILGIGNADIKPFLSSITRPNGDEEIILKLFNANEEFDSFKDVDITFDNIIIEKGVSYPTTINISAKSNNGNLNGTFKYTKKIAHFNLNEHLNFLEKSISKTNPLVNSFRYLVDYSLVYKTAEGEKTFASKALSEYTNITSSTITSQKKRRRNRR